MFADRVVVRWFASGQNITVLQTCAASTFRRVVAEVLRGARFALHSPFVSASMVWGVAL